MAHSPSNPPSFLQAPDPSTASWLKKLATVLFGAQQTELLGTHQQRIAPEISSGAMPMPEPDLTIGTARRGPRPRMQMVYDALAEAAATFEYNEVKPLRDLVPSTVFQLSQILTTCTPEGMALLSEAKRLNETHRKKLVTSKISHLGFDLSQFAGWRIEEATDATQAFDPTAEGDMITVIAGDGAWRVKLDFQFFGSFEEVNEPLAQPSPTQPAASPIAPPVPQPTIPRTGAIPLPKATTAAAATLVAEPPRPVHAAATLMNEHSAPPPTRPALAHLRLTTMEGSEQLIAITTLPFEIGREPTLPDGLQACTVPDAAAKVSRVHLRLEKHQGGAWVVHNLAYQSNGTWRNGEKLDQHFTLTPVPATSKAGWHILGERNLSSHSVAIRVEQTA